MSRSAPASRQSKTKCADPQDGQYGPSRGGSLSRPLTERDGVTLREEVRDWGALDGTRPVSWREAVWAWREYIRDRRTVEGPVFEGPDGGEFEGAKRPHRFHPDYADRQYAKLNDLETGVRERWGRGAHAALISLTASSTDGEGEPVPPVDHLDDLLGAWPAVKRALSRALDGREWCRARILDVHESGYLHVHVGVFVRGPVEAETFRPVIEAHLRNCDLAGEDAHEIVPDQPNESAVSVHRVGTDQEEGEIENLAAYLAEYLGTYGEDDPLDLPEHRQMANAILWATGRRRFQPDTDAREFTQYTGEGAQEGDESGEFEMVGLVIDGEVKEVVEGAGGVDTFTTGPRAKPPPGG